MRSVENIRDKLISCGSINEAVIFCSVLHEKGVHWAGGGQLNIR